MFSDGAGEPGQFAPVCIAHVGDFAGFFRQRPRTHRTHRFQRNYFSILGWKASSGDLVAGFGGFQNEDGVPARRER
jgi:hypothetical protein